MCAKIVVLCCVAYVYLFIITVVFLPPCLELYLIAAVKRHSFVFVDFKTFTIFDPNYILC